MGFLYRAGGPLWATAGRSASMPNGRRLDQPPVREARGVQGRILLPPDGPFTFNPSSVGRAQQLPHGRSGSSAVGSPPSLSSIAPKRSMRPSRTARVGICPEACHPLRAHNIESDPPAEPLT